MSPCSIGSLGVIHPLDMTNALCSQIVVKLLTSDKPIGSQFCHALHHHLHNEYDAVPAHFILQSGLPWQHMNNCIFTQ